MKRTRKGLLFAFLVAVPLVWFLLWRPDRFFLLFFVGLALLLVAVNLRAFHSRRASSTEGEDAADSASRGGAPPSLRSARLRDPVRVYRTFRPAEVMLAKMHLEGEGIPFATGNEYFSSLYPSADGMASVEILVDRNDVERARAVLDPLLKGAAPE